MVTKSVWYKILFGLIFNRDTLKHKIYYVGFYESVLDTSRHVQFLEKWAILVTATVKIFVSLKDIIDRAHPGRIVG